MSIVAWLMGMGSAVAAAPTFPVGTLVVDDDGAECPDASYTTIRDAVLAAGEGGTVGVCPGTYDERVRIDKTITVLGAQHEKDGRSRSLQSPGEAVVVGDRPFDVFADDVVIDGFRIVVVPDASGEGWGVRTSGRYSGYRIEDNVMDADGVTAVFPGSSGVSPTLVTRNHFFDRLGVATSADEPLAEGRNLRIVDNRFSQSSVSLHSGADRDVVIERNRFRGGAVRVTGVSQVTISDNRFKEPDALAISVHESGDVTVAGNTVRGGEHIGIYVSGANQGVAVEGNRVERTGSAGIALFHATGVTLSENESDGNDGGVWISGASGALVRGNVADDNLSYGIRVGGTSSGNVLDGNSAHGNGPKGDCLDQTTGDGTAGTANTWTGNAGATSYPAGLCADRP